MLWARAPVLLWFPLIWAILTPPETNQTTIIGNVDTAQARSPSPLPENLPFIWGHPPSLLATEFWLDPVGFHPNFFSDWPRAFVSYSNQSYPRSYGDTCMLHIKFYIRQSTTLEMLLEIILNIYMTAISLQIWNISIFLKNVERAYSAKLSLATCSMLANVKSIGFLHLSW
jgi:hypothetical protein